MLETGRALFSGDNLDWLAKIPDQYVDLVYLDPPFKSDQNYNVLFREHDNAPDSAQIKVFTDTWKWTTEVARKLDDVIATSGRLSVAMQALRSLLGGSDMMAYLTMMAPRLVQMRRVMKPHAAIYLHCDPAASHYLKLLMDAVFGPDNFSNELVWRRTTTKNDYRQGAVNWPRVHDVLLVYYRSVTKARDAKRFKQPFAPYDDSYLDTFYTFKDSGGRRYRLSDLTAPGQGSRGHPKYEFLGVTRFWRYNQEKMEQLYRDGRIETRPGGKVPMYKRYLDEMPGVAIGDVWTDIRGMINLSKETQTVGYPTQKPLALLERIIEANTNKGEVVLDPFCGCGTAIAVAEKLERRWIGIDISFLATSTITRRLRESFPGIKWEADGEPTTLQGAHHLAKLDPYHFQWWVLQRLGVGEDRHDRRRGPDGGIDGRQFFTERPGGPVKQIIYQVKSGIVHRNVMHELGGVRGREKAEIGVLVTLQPPTKKMLEEAASSDFWTTEWGKHPRLQILTVEALLKGKGVDAPPQAQLHVKKRSAAEVSRHADEGQLFLPLLYSVPALPQQHQIAARPKRRRASAG